MIDSNNQLKKLSHSLINSVRGVMEATKEGGVPKTDKHKDLAAKAPPHDKITHADVLVGRGVLKKHPTSGKLVTKEEVEEIDELSKKTLGSYVNKAAERTGTQGVIAGLKIARDEKSNKNLKTMDKRQMGIGKAVERLTKEEVEEIDELSRKTLGSYVKKASISAADKGVEHGTKKAEADEMDRVMNRHMSFSDKDKVRNIMKTTVKDYEKPREKALRRIQGIGKAVNRLTREESGLDLARTVLNNIRNELAEGVEGIDEALDAAARYGQHHVAIKDLLKSIDQHVRNHKDEALKHKDYRGKKGVHWGHVGDISQVHSQLADIHDRLAQQGEYKKSMSESIDEDVQEIKTTQDIIRRVARNADRLAGLQKHAGIAGKVDPDGFKRVTAERGRLEPGRFAQHKMKEDVDQIDELSKKTLGSYIKKAGGLSLNSAGSHMYQAGKAEYDTPGSKKLFKQGVKRAQGVETAVNKMMKESPVDGVAPGSMDNNGHLCATKVFHKEWAEGVPIFSQHAEPDANGNIAWYDVMFEHGIEKGVWTEDLEILMTESHERHGKRKMKEENELDEARGRPRKNPLPDGKKGDPDEVEARMHIIQQLERAKLSMRGGEPVSFMDGTKHTVHSPDANKIIMKYHSMKPYEKEIFQKKIHASHAGLKAEL